ncbi:MAG: hypothetical protein COA57_16220 [Flavobacteriales bacterium]|nr:MAG: hypothetical protein COA57_16220 [Flavobacteriales bacterium]
MKIFLLFTMLLGHTELIAQNTYIQLKKKNSEKVRLIGANGKVKIVDTEGNKSGFERIISLEGDQIILEKFGVIKIADISSIYKKGTRDAKLILYSAGIALFMFGSAGIYYIEAVYNYVGLLIPFVIGIELMAIATGIAVPVVGAAIKGKYKIPDKWEITIITLPEKEKNETD